MSSRNSASAVQQPAGSAAAARRPWLARLHPGLFAIPLGTLGLAGAWQRLVPLGYTIGNPVSLALFGTGLALLALFTVLWCVKLARHAGVVRQEWEHPVQGPLLALLPVAVLVSIALIAPAAQLLGMGTALALLTVAALLLEGLMAWRVVARLSAGQMPHELITPVLYLPTVAGGFVGAIAVGAQDQPGWAALLVGMGIGAWALLEMRILNRLFAGPLPAALRPTLGMEIAPGAVGSLAVASVWPTLPPEALVVCLGIASGPLFAVLTRWRAWTSVPFSAGFWSFSFPLAALAAATAETVRRGAWPPPVALAAVGIVTVVIAFLGVRTVALLARGQLLPPQ